MPYPNLCLPLLLQLQALTGSHLLLDKDDILWSCGLLRCSESTSSEAAEAAMLCCLAAVVRKALERLQPRLHKALPHGPSDTGCA